MAKTVDQYFRRIAADTSLAVDLPQRNRIEHAEACAGDSAECFSAPVLDQGAHAHAEFQRNVVLGDADAGNVPDSGGDRHSADALLPSVGRRRLTPTPKTCSS